MSKTVGDSSMNDANKLTALVADDKAVIRKIEKMLLNKKVFKTGQEILTIKVMENGQEAVNTFLEGNSFDVIIMDMEMPIMDGIQATKELQAMGIKCLIFGVTSFESKSDIQAFVEAGLDEYFPKPLDFVKIDNILKRLEK